MYSMPQNRRRSLKLLTEYDSPSDPFGMAALFREEARTLTHCTRYAPWLAEKESRRVQEVVQRDGTVGYQLTQEGCDDSGSLATDRKRLRRVPGDRFFVGGRGQQPQA
jgi:hypothetical protein